MAPSLPAAAAQSLDYWRRFFSGARATIFDTINAAIRVAAADNPYGLLVHRDAIAEGLFTAINVLPTPEVAVAPPAAATAAAPSLADQKQQLLPEGAGSLPGLCSSDDAPLLDSDDLVVDSDDLVVAEVLRVKAALSSNQEKSETELLELLGRLEQLKFTMPIIRDTQIGTTVQPLGKHRAKPIRQLVRSLIEGWKVVVQEWVSNEGAILDHTPQSMHASSLEQEGGLPSPPMDEAGFFVEPCTYMQLSEFLDELDDDGNLRINSKEGEHYPTNQELVKKQPSMGEQYDPVGNWRLDQSTARPRLHEPSSLQMGQQSLVEEKGKVSSAAVSLGRPQRLHPKLRSSEIKPKQQWDLAAAQRGLNPTMANQPSSQQDPNSLKSKLELAKRAKLEATKRKLQDGYQEFNNAKKQRHMQLVDPQDVPKQGSKITQPGGKSRNNKVSNLRARLGVRR